MLLFVEFIRAEILVGVRCYLNKIWNSFYVSACNWFLEIILFACRANRKRLKTLGKHTKTNSNKSK